MPAEEEPPELDFPDPRTWPGNPEIWGLVRDIQVLDQVAEVLNGKAARETDAPEYLKARRFLAESVAQACEDLSRMVLAFCQVPVTDDAAPSPFSGAGRPRAFGAESPPPAGTLCPD